MNHKKYISPELEILSLTMVDVLTASNYVPDPENPVRSGLDEPINDDL